MNIVPSNSEHVLPSAVPGARSSTPARSRQSSPALWHALDDLARALKAWRVWVLLGMLDIRQRYRRSRLGQFWITASMAVTVGGIGIVFSGIFGEPASGYLPFVASGFVVWALLTGIITDGCATFIESAIYAKQLTVPLSVYALKTLFRSLLTFAHNLIILPLVWLAFPVALGWPILLMVPGVVLIAINGLWILLLLGTLCARFRDLPQIVSSSMQVVFFITPIMFQPEQLPDALHAVLTFNPFAALLSMARDPLIGRVPSAHEYGMVVLMALLGWLITIPFFGRYRQRIAYWL
jgi:ABC-type polysaccharide/polyol phosphate export permease